jgi:hypothetical protein
MTKGREAVDFHQSNCKKSRVWSLNRSHYGQSPNFQRLSKKATDSRRKFGLDGNGNPKYGREAISFFSIKKSIIDKILTVRLEGLFWARNKVECSLGFGLWSLHTMPDWRLHLLYFIGYFQPISLDFQQCLATQSHDLSTWTAIVWSGLRCLQSPTNLCC